MGTTLTSMSVVFDTASDWLAVADAACGSCEGNKYEAAQGTQVNDLRLERVYGNIEIEANVYSDRVCLLTSSCVADFEYLAI